MDVLAVLFALAVLVVSALTLRELRRAAAQAATNGRVLASTLGDIQGRQRDLAREYEEVHKILEAIRDLNKAELQDRKEILQHTNLAASSRVLQVRTRMQQLEEAAQKELDGMGGGR